MTHLTASSFITAAFGLLLATAACSSDSAAPGVGGNSGSATANGGSGGSKAMGTGGSSTPATGGASGSAGGGAGGGVGGTGGGGAGGASGAGEGGASGAGPGGASSTDASDGNADDGGVGAAGRNDAGTAGQGGGSVSDASGTPGACTWRNTAPVTIATPFAVPDNSLTFTPPTIPCVMFSIADYGAKGDGTTLNSTAFSQAVAAAKAAGGGVVDVPSGTFLTGAIHLDSKIELHLEPGAVVKFSAMASDYLPAVLTRWEGLDVLNYSPLVYALNATDVAITGTGTLQGPGTSWGGGISAWKTASASVDDSMYKVYYTALPKGVGTLPTPPNAVQPNGAPGLRPAFVECNGCKNFLIDGPTVTGSPYWTLHPLYSSNVIIRNAKVDTSANGTGSNGDGTDPDSVSNCLIDNVTYATSDDNIAIKSGLNEAGIAVGKPSHNIVIRNVKSSTGHGGITIGSEMSGGVNNVYATADSFLGVEDPIRIKTLNGRGGIIENLWYENLTVSWTKDAIIMTTQYTSSTVAPHDTSLVPTLRNVHITGVTGTGSGPEYNITGPASGFTLGNLKLTGTKAGTCTGTTNITMTNVTFAGMVAKALTGC